jgi:tetratricopeptide (TPR) repeat protein
MKEVFLKPFDVMRTLNKTHILPSALVALASVIIYIPTLKSGFLWDDIQLITRPLKTSENPFAFFFGGGVFYRPLLVLSLTFDYSLWHLNALGFHLTNILLHTLNSFLVFFLGMMLIKNNKTWVISDSEEKNRLGIILPSFLAALFFALHPIHTESVAWISGRTDILSTLFFLLSFVSYLTYEEDGKTRSLIISSLFFLFALFSKENAISFILVVLAYGIITKIPRKRIMISLSTFVSVIVIYFLFRKATVITMMLAPPSSQEAFFASGLTFERMANLVVQGTGYYFERLILPFNLSLLPEVPDKPLYLLFFVLPFVVGGAAYSSGRRLEAFLVTWLIITLLPSLSLLLSRMAPLGERYLYLPSVGFCILLGLLLSRLREKKAVCMVVLAVLIAYSVSSHTRLDAWRSDLALWEETVRKNPTSATARANYGAALIEGKDLDKGRRELHNALNQKVSFQQASSIYNLLGSVEMKEKNYGKAEEYFSDSLRSSSNNASTYNNLGLLYLRMYESAEAEFSKKEFLDKSIAFLDKALALSPRFLAPKLNLGLCYYKRGELKKAEGYLYSVIESDPRSDLSAQAFQLLIAIEFAKNRESRRIS